MESLVEENARLRQEVVELKTIIERLEHRVQELQRALEEAQRAGKRSGRRRSRGAGPKLIPPSLGGKPGPGMVAVVGARFPRTLTEAWKQPGSGCEDYNSESPTNERGHTSRQRRDSRNNCCPPFSTRPPKTFKPRSASIAVDTTRFAVPEITAATE